MAEEDAEIALLHRLQAGQEGVAWGADGENGATEGEIPSSIEDNNEQDKKQTVADDEVLRAFSPSGSGAVSDDGDEYDPSSVTPLPAAVIAAEEQSRSSSRESSRKPKTVGGFLADDSDEETDDSSSVQISTGLQPAAPNTLNRPISPSPLQVSVTPSDLRSPTQNQDDSHKGGLSPNTLSVNQTISGAASASQAPSDQTLMPAGGPADQNASAPKGRLPHDRIGILEDRIKEDPRGDLEAWRSLISEHRKRNKFEDARAVYERFFKVFPQAVCVPSFSIFTTNTP
jgi:cleavage stimulation factor subunit 3